MSSGLVAAAKVVGVGGGDSLTDPAQMRREIAEIAGIGIDGILAGAALCREHVEKKPDQSVVGGICVSRHGRMCALVVRF